MAEVPGAIDQVEFWNGDVGRKWLANHKRMDRAFAALTAPLLARAAPREGERVLDIGCGAGEVSLAVAGLVGSAGRVVGVDISRPLLEGARARDSGREVEWQEADAGSFAFAPGGFDLALSRFGTMFFADPVAAFANIRRALRPGGRLVMLAWRTMPENAFVAVPRAAMLLVVPPPPPVPPDAPGPFAFADAARVGAILASAGFTQVRSSPLDVVLDTGADAEERLRWMVELGPASALLRDAAPDVLDRATLAVRAANQAQEAAGKAVNRAACWLFAAENPA